MANGESTRTFYILFALLVISLVAGGSILWKKMGQPADRPPDPPSRNPTRFVGTARGPDARIPDRGRRPGSEPSRTGERPARDPDFTSRPAPGNTRQPGTVGAGAPRGDVTSMADLLRGLAAIKAKGSTVNSRAELAALGRELAAEDFDNALRLMNAVSDFFTKSNLCRGIFELQGINDPDAAVAAARALDPGKKSGSAALQAKRIYYEALMASMKGWSQTSPSSAADYIGELPGDYRLVAAQSVYTAWAQSDPAAAINGLSALTDEAVARILPEVLSGWAETDPGQAWDYVVTLPGDVFEEKNLVLANIATAWAQRDAAMAVSRIDRTLTDDRQYADVLERVTRNLTTKSPETAAALLAAVPGMYQRQSTLLKSTLQSWVATDADAASAWVLSLTDAEMQAQAVKLTASFWGSRDLASAVDWADSLQGELSRAYALSNVAVQQGNRNPETSVDWIYEIDNDFARGRTLAGYIMGRTRRAGDRATSDALRQMISSDEINFGIVEQLVIKATISDEEKATLLGLIR